LAGAKETTNPAAVKKAMDARAPKDPKPERRELTAPDVQKLVACMRANGIHAPSDPAALKRWLEQKEASDLDAIKRVVPTRKMQLDPGATKEATPGVCGDDATKSGGKAARPEETSPPSRRRARTPRPRAAWRPTTSGLGLRPAELPCPAGAPSGLSGASRSGARGQLGDRTLSKRDGHRQIRFA
jgi:hypothetical protein